ncbi:PKD domain-containing protein [uncultured Microscilla sp.]|uniref:T9SS type A sorting domain-containing protein n=1 Tax=uncultured Microscilla sp. TaxID=432653 RepID=UPI0026071605|nr:PKD domain-containing protein [uncultured Microscilla sp.]
MKTLTLSKTQASFTLLALAGIIGLWLQTHPAIRSSWWRATPQVVNPPNLPALPSGHFLPLLKPTAAAGNVVITAPDFTGTAALCKDGQFVTLPNITIYETTNDSFTDTNPNNDTDLAMNVVLRVRTANTTNFEFKTGPGSVSVAANTSGTNIKSISTTEVINTGAMYYFDITFDLLKNDKLDAITISGLQVRALSATAVASEAIYPGGITTDGVFTGLSESAASPLATYGSKTSPADLNLTGLTNVDICVGATFTAADKFNVNGGTGTTNWYSDLALTNQVATGNEVLVQNGAESIGSNALIGVEPTTATTLTYYARREHNGCYSAVKTVTVTVHEPPTVSLIRNAASNEICRGETLSYTATGASSYVFQIDKGSGFATVTAAEGTVTGGTFTTKANLPANNYSLRVVGTASGANGGCQVTSSPNQDFTVHPKPTVTASSGATVVTTGSTTTLSGNPTGGVFTGPGVKQTGASTYIFDSNGLATGQTYNVVYTYKNGTTNCENTDNIDIDVTELEPLIQLNNGPSDPLPINICKENTSFAAKVNTGKSEISASCAFLNTLQSSSYSVSSPTSGLITSVNSSSGTFTFNPGAVGTITTPTVVTINVTANHVCRHTVTNALTNVVKNESTQVTIYPGLELSIAVTDPNAPTSYCNNQGTDFNFTLKNRSSIITKEVQFYLSTDNGPFTTVLNSSNKISNINHTFNPQQLGVGTHRIKFAHTDVCSKESSLITIQVLAPPTIDFANIAASTYCNGVGNTLQLAPTVNGGSPTALEAQNGTFSIKDGANITSLGAAVHSINLSTLTAGKTYKVYYTYTVGSCAVTTPEKDLVITATPTLEVEGITNNASYCTNTNDISLVAKVTPAGGGGANTVTLGTAQDYIKLKNLGTSVETTLPDDQLKITTLPAGKYEVTFVHAETGLNKCSSSLTYTITTNKPSEASFAGINDGDVFCLDKGNVALTRLVNNQSPPVPANGEFRIWQEAPSSFEYKFSSASFHTKNDLNGVGTYKITYSYEDANNCKDTSVVVSFNVVPAPENIRITSTKDYDKPELQYTSAATNSVSWAWDFKDGTSAAAQNPLKTLSSPDNTVIHNYEVVIANTSGCQATITKSYNVNFTFKGKCLGTPTQFTDVSTSLTDDLTSWAWDFGDGNTSTVQNPLHSYAAPGTYPVSLTVTTKDGIASYTLRKRIDIFPVIAVSPNTPYIQDFTSGAANWISHGWVDVSGLKKDSTSWKVKTPAGIAQHIPADKGNAWVTDNSDNPAKTDTIANYNANEQSYVESPCFDINALNRPMVSFDYWSDTDRGGDGVVLLYTVDDGATWHRVGEQNQGLDWYNTKPILGKPGDDFTTSNGDGQGWSGNAQSTITTLGWKRARFGLDAVLQKMIAENITNRIVRFRVAFGSNADNNPDVKYDGFAFDNFQVNNRNRLVLMEYFINQAVTNAATLDATTHAYANSKAEAINIHYHTAFPGNDAINNQSPKDPSGRAFHYGIREVPRPTLDGQVRDESITGSYVGTWVDTAFAQRTLRAAPFLINISQATATNGTLTVSATVNAIEALDRKVVMHIAVIEDTINIEGNNYYNAVRKMLPDAAGTFRAQSWVVGNSQTLNETWNYSAVTGLSPNNLRVVVFVADYETKEIYQAEVSDVLANGRENDVNDENQVTGVVDDLKAGKWSIFPNPAADQLNISFPANGSTKSLTEDIKWEVVNVSGQTVKQGRWTRGSRQWSLRVNDLASGVYIIKLSNRQFTVQRRFEKH